MPPVGGSAAGGMLNWEKLRHCDALALPRRQNAVLWVAMAAWLGAFGGIVDACDGNQRLESCTGCGASTHAGLALAPSSDAKKFPLRPGSKSIPPAATNQPWLKVETVSLRFHQCYLPLRNTAVGDLGLPDGGGRDREHLGLGNPYPRQLGPGWRRQRRESPEPEV